MNGDDAAYEEGGYPEDYPPEENYEEQQGAAMSAFAGDENRIRDMEEKQRILKDRLLLIGQNLIETKEDLNEKILDLKRDILILKQNMEKLTTFLETVSVEFSKFAKKEDLDILIKQANLFQITRKKDLKK